MDKILIISKLSYDPETGVIVRKSDGHEVGTVICRTKSLKYRKIRIGDGVYFAHRVA